MQKNNRAFIEVTLIMCAILATICISAGVISLLAHNWDGFPKAVRLILSFVPVAAGIGVFYQAFFKHHHSKVWMESAATFLVLMTGSSIALVTQIYHIGNFNQILLVWMLLSLPVLYLAHSSAVTIVYLAGITWWLVMQNLHAFDFFGGRWVNKPVEIFGYWALILAVVPHFMRFYKSGVQTLRTQILGWFSIVIVLYGANLGFALHHTVGYSLAIAAAYVLGKILFPHGEYFWNRPFQTVALLATTILAFFLSNNYYLHYSMQSNHYISMRSYSDFPSADMGPDGMIKGLSYLLIAAFVGFILFFFIKDQSKEKRMNPLLVFFPFVVAIGLFLAYSQRLHGENSWFSAYSHQYTFAKIWFNLYIVGFCAYYLYKGIQLHINGIVTYAIFMLSVLLLVRYLDTNIDFSLKGLLYIGFGVALLFFNKYYTAKALDHDNDQDKNSGSNTPIDQI